MIPLATRPDPARVAAIIRETAEIEVLPRFGTLVKSQIREKKPGDLVTEADIAAERRLAAELPSLL
ncbi:MAG: inositol monophosphatase, partial [Rhodospirillales bacterium]|nr:inositol monophosphatase [Rhodospirillales bacterium]